MSLTYKTEVSENKATVTLCTEGDKFYFDRQSIAGFSGILGDLTGDVDSIRVCSDNDKVFSLGFNPKEFKFDVKPVEDIKYGIQLGQKLVKQIYESDAEIEFDVRGFCLGAGLEFALAAQKLTLADCSKLKFPEPNIGIGWFPAYGGLYLMAKRMGKGFMLEHLRNPRFFGKAQLQELNEKFPDRYDDLEEIELVMDIADSPDLESAQLLSLELFIKRIRKQYNK